MQRITRKQRAYAPLIGSAFAIISLPSLARGEDPSRGVPVIWDGEAGDMQWFNPTNWDPDALPGKSDTVLIQIGGPVIALNQPITVDSLNAQTGLTLSSSSLAIFNPSIINGLFIDGLSPTIDSSTSTLNITGTSAFTSATKWAGAGTTLDGSITTIGGVAVQPDSTLVLAGDLSFLANQNFSQAVNAHVTITGSITLSSGASIFSAGNAQALWEFTGGSLNQVGASTCTVDDDISMTNGTISADGGDLLFDNNYTITGSTVSSTNDAVIDFDGNTGGNPSNTIHVSSFSGNGDIDISGSPTSIGSQSGLSTASMMAPGELRLRNGIIIEDELSNTGTMTLFGASLSGDNGRLTAADGVIESRLSTLLAVETIVQSGGKMVFTDDTRVDRTLRVNQGGVLELNKSINALFPTKNALAKVEIGGLLSMPTGGSNSDINIPFNILSGGTVQIEDRRLQLKAGGRLQNGSVSFVDTGASGFPSLGFNGDDQDTWIFETGLTIANNGARADLFFGNGFGSQPNMTINGNLTLNMTGTPNIAKTRVNRIAGDGTLVNQGNLTIERSVVMETDLTNSGSMVLQAAITLKSSTQLVVLTNESSGTVTQKNTILLDTLVRIENAGNWIIPNGVIMRETIGTDPLDTFFTNNGTLRATSGTSTFFGVFINNGQIIADSATLSILNPTTVDQQGRTVISGEWETRNNGKILIPSNTAPSVVTGPSTRVIGGGTDQPWIRDVDSVEDGATAELVDTRFNNLVNFDDSDLVVSQDSLVTATDVFFENDSNGTIEPGATLEADNEINSGNDDPDLPSVLDDIQGVTLIGLGPITPPTLRAMTVNIFANLTPILDDIGTMIVDGDLVIHPTGKLNINLDGVAASRVDVSGDLTVDGSVMISTLNGYTPVLGDSFSIATVAGATNALPNRAIGDAGVGLAYGLVISGSDVLVRVVCSADLTNDGVLNFFDVSSFLSTLPDYNNDGGFNFFDVSAFLVDFGEGCS